MNKATLKAVLEALDPNNRNNRGRGNSALVVIARKDLNDLFKEVQKLSGITYPVKAEVIVPQPTKQPDQIKTIISPTAPWPFPVSKK